MSDLGERILALPELLRDPITGWIPIALPEDVDGPRKTYRISFEDFGTGAADRFGVAGEDDTATEDRIFNAAGTYNINIYNWTNFAASTTDDSATLQMAINSTDNLRHGALQVDAFSSLLAYSDTGGSPFTARVGVNSLGVTMPDLDVNDASDNYLWVDVSGTVHKTSAAPGGGGGSSSKFGFAGEDDVAGENRSFDADENQFQILNSSLFLVFTQGDSNEVNLRAFNTLGDQRSDLEVRTMSIGLSHRDTTTTPNGGGAIYINYAGVNIQSDVGCYFPLHTTAGRLAITPTDGCTVYDTDLHKMFTYDGTTWQAHW